MKNIYFVIILIFMLASCSTKKNIVYLQDLSDVEIYQNKYSAYKLKTDDILKIDVYTDPPESALSFNPKGNSSSFLNSKDGIIYNGYQVNPLGKIVFPVLGEIYVEGLTTENVRQLLSKKIIEGGYLNEFSLDVKHINSHFTVIGEVQNPGKFEFLKNNLNVFEALGMAGDLTINGERKDIKLIRDNNGNKKIFEIDLTNTEILGQKQFQIISGDILIVNPNSSRVKNAGIIGNSGTLLSLLSFLLSSIIVIKS